MDGKDKKNWPLVSWESQPKETYFPLLPELQLQPSNEQIMEIVFGREWNIFRYHQGLGGLMFPCSSDVSGPGIFSVDTETDEDDDDELVDQDELEEKRQE